MVTRLGSLSIAVEIDGDGNVAVHHGTDFASPLDERQHAMSDNEKRRAKALRSVVCQAAAEFFLYVRDPDLPVTSDIGH